MSSHAPSEKPEFPKKVVVTAGMPYGNKDLHFGHIGGVFIYADVFARFMRDRIGSENVLFVSGTDGYGSPIVQAHQKLQTESDYQGSIADFVQSNHDKQKSVLSRYDISLDRFAMSCSGSDNKAHEAISNEIFKSLHSNGQLKKMTTQQFYDPEHETFLNGRQVTGKCPIQGCQSEIAYADECSLGHQYPPNELLFPKSVLSGKRPEMRDVTNWFIDLPSFLQPLEEWVKRLDNGTKGRSFYLRNISEFFEPPIVHVKRDQEEKIDEIKAKLPSFRIQDGQTKAMRLEFSSLEDREEACKRLTEAEVRYRTGKTLVPFRLTGNIEWGLPIPEVDGLKDLTWWVWPESLIAPISFTAAHLSEGDEINQDWKQWWCQKDSQIVQFIGEDNIYFYGIAEIAMFLGTQGSDPSEISSQPADGQLQLPQLVVNNHLLFLDKKASSSGKVKPPMAAELLDYYTSDQLRAHFISLGLGLRSVSFRPKPLNPNADPKGGDPVLKEGNLLSNVFNKSLRSCFYTLQNMFAAEFPGVPVSQTTLDWCDTVIAKFEKQMIEHEFHFAMATLDKFIRESSKYWAGESKRADSEDDEGIRQQALVDLFHLCRVATVLLHPIAPKGCAIVREHYNIQHEIFFSWDHIRTAIGDLIKADHKFKELEPRKDFFGKHPSQFKKMN
ncbi:MAG: class I tRNA ligase family protein [Pseudobacteriovorax sp.]|nr:class I tRNA ligase family protein [Pseudobacteriovorax sp.]